MRDILFSVLRVVVILLILVANFFFSLFARIFFRRKDAAPAHVEETHEESTLPMREKGSAVISSKPTSDAHLRSLDELVSLTTPEEKRPSPKTQTEAPKVEEEPWKKYPQIYRFEILYWRAVSKPWWWNNYAQELIEYAQEYLPIAKLELFATYNSNSKGEDFKKHKKRIQQLKPKKISKHPLVVINYDKEYIMVASKDDLEAMKDRIDAEWMRHYRFKKTYR